METKNFVVYKSSAGSGKTFTLVKEYLKLALVNKHLLTTNYKGILAITFTNKAAAEMKWRIIKALDEISNGQNDFLSQLIADDLNIEKTELQQRANVVLTDVLHNYSDFSIGTIDSFTHRIIRTFALDLKLPMNFQIELDAEDVFRKVISLLINNLGKEKIITDYLVQFSMAQVEDNKSWDPEQTLFDFIKEINKEGVAELIDKLADFDIGSFDAIKKQIEIVVKNYKNTLKQHGEKALKLIHDKGLTGEELSNGKGGIYNMYVKLTKLKEISEKELFTDTINKNVIADKWYAGKATQSNKDDIDTIKTDLEQIANDVRNYIQANAQRFNVYQLIYKNIYAMGLVNELAKLTAEYKKEENILFISEFNELIAGVVNDEPTPFIFERIGNRYKHFLIDEFQDTSGMQWQNMLPLIDNSLGNANLNLIVGDGKQSIYRWRNADVKQFVSLPHLLIEHKNDILIERENALIRNYKNEVLNKNFRSDSIIVNFNNTMFEHLSATFLNEEFQKIYHQQKQEPKKENAGYVSLQFPEITDGDKDSTNLTYIQSHIYNALQDGYNYSDICIIVSKNRDGSTIANYLIEHQIPVVSADSLLLSKSNEVTVLVSFLKYLANQKDLVSAAVIINYLFENKYCNEEQCITFLRELNKPKSKTLFKIIIECGITIDKAKLLSSNVFDMCIEIVSMLQLNKKNPQYIRFFIDEVLSFLHAHTSNLALFIDWWEKRSEKASVIIPEGIDAVNIMTIHSCKGLEFKIVISPYMAWDIEKPKSIWVNLHEDELELPVALINTSKQANETIYKPLAENERLQQTLDSLNMLYVDFTRAINRLHIISVKPKVAKEKNIHHWLIDFASKQRDYDSNLKQLSYGELIPKNNETDDKKGLEQLPITHLNFNLNNDIIKIKKASLYSSSEEVEKAREYGILIHSILSKINTIDDIEMTVNEFKLSGDITSAESETITQEIKQILTHKTIADYFKKETTSRSYQIKNELEILTSKGDVLRPDRVVITNNNAIVIDYKTGKKHAQKYHLQMYDYENALLELGYDTVKKILIYIHEKEVEVL